jgi:hypothetical protein
MAILRAYTHPSNLHEVGVYHTLTGKINNTLAVPRNMRNRNDFPNPGAIVSYLSPPQAMPASVTIPKPIGHDGVIYTGTYAGFLGARQHPLEQAPASAERAPQPRIAARLGRPLLPRRPSENAAKRPRTGRATAAHT